MARERGRILAQVKGRESKRIRDAKARAIREAKGRELRKIRAALGMTQVELAAELGVAPNTVARWEQGRLLLRPPIERLIRTVVEARR